MSELSSLEQWLKSQCEKRGHVNISAEAAMYTFKRLRDAKAIYCQWINAPLGTVYVWWNQPE